MQANATRATAAINDGVTQTGVTSVQKRGSSSRKRDGEGALLSAVAHQKKNAPEVVARQMPYGEVGIVYDPCYPIYTASSCGRPLICF